MKCTNQKMKITLHNKIILKFNWLLIIICQYYDIYINESMTAETVN